MYLPSFQQYTNSFEKNNRPDGPVSWPSCCTVPRLTVCRPTPLYSSLSFLRTAVFLLQSPPVPARVPLCVMGHRVTPPTLPFTGSPGLSSVTALPPFWVNAFSFTRGSISTSGGRLTLHWGSVAVLSGSSSWGLLSDTTQVLVTYGKTRLAHGRCCSRMLGAQGLWIPWEYPSGLRAHSPKQSWVPQLVVSKSFRVS